jgi:chromosome segregation ATPase
MFVFVPEFVKKGSSTATIEITLRNTGSCNYKKDAYGDRITVTRTISSATGQGCYKIKTGQGTWLSSPLFFVSSSDV